MIGVHLSMLSFPIVVPIHNSVLFVRGLPTRSISFQDRVFTSLWLLASLPRDSSEVLVCLHNAVVDTCNTAEHTFFLLGETLFIVDSSSFLQGHVLAMVLDSRLQCCIPCDQVYVFDLRVTIADDLYFLTLVERRREAKFSCSYMVRGYFCLARRLGGIFIIRLLNSTQIGLTTCNLNFPGIATALFILFIFLLIGVLRGFRQSDVLEVLALRFIDEGALIRIILNDNILIDRSQSMLSIFCCSSLITSLLLGSICPQIVTIHVLLWHETAEYSGIVGGSIVDCAIC